jgi:hypothetical protein
MKKTKVPVPELAKFNPTAAKFNPIPNRLLSIQTVAELQGVSKRELFKLLERNGCPTTVAGFRRRKFITSENFEKYFPRNKQ